MYILRSALSNSKVLQSNFRNLSLETNLNNIFIPFLFQPQLSDILQTPPPIPTSYSTAYFFTYSDRKSKLQVHLFSFKFAK